MANPTHPNRSMVSLLGLAGVAFLLVLPIAVAILAAIANSERDGRIILLVETATLWFAWYVGMLVTIVGLVALFIALLNPTQHGIQSAAGWIVVVLLGTLIQSPHWAIALGIGWIVATLVLAQVLAQFAHGRSGADDGRTTGM